MGQIDDTAQTPDPVDRFLQGKTSGNVLFHVQAYDLSIPGGEFNTGNHPRQRGIRHGETFGGKRTLHRVVICHGNTIYPPSFGLPKQFIRGYQTVGGEGGMVVEIQPQSRHEAGSHVR